MDHTNLINHSNHGVRYTFETIDVPSSGINFRGSDEFVEDASYLRLKNIQLGYNLPVSDLGIQWLRSLRIYASAQNLLTVTDYSGYDPEINNQGNATVGGNTDILLSMLWVMSCSDYLEEEPVSFLSDTQFYQTQSDAIAAVNAAYQPLATGGYYGQQFFAQTETKAEYGLGRGSHQPSGVYQLDQTNIGRIAGIWRLAYLSINRANAVLGRVPAMELEEGIKVRILAEAHFLRALNYFNLVRLWGPVPLQKEEISSIVNFSFPRTPVDEIYTLIIDDLLIAEQGLRLRAEQMAAAELYAEADARVDGNLSAQGLEYINMIRRRAYGKDINIPDPSVDFASGLTTDEYLDIIFDERGKEFLLESKRWFDMLRYDNVEELLTTSGFTYSPTVLLWPIPQEEIDNNEALTQADQNPGY